MGLNKTMLAGIIAGMSRGGPSQSYDFTTGSLPAGVTFTRAGARNFFNSSGVLASAATDVPCFEYDNNLSCLGLSVNDAATNICLRSNAFSTTWSNSASMVLTSGQTGPDGSASAWKVAPSSGGGNQRLYQSITISNATRYVYSVYVKASVYTRIRIIAGDTVQGMRITCKLDTAPSFRTSTGTNFTDVIGGYEL